MLDAGDRSSVVARHSPVLKLRNRRRTNSISASSSSSSSSSSPRHVVMASSDRLERMVRAIRLPSPLAHSPIHLTPYTLSLQASLVKLGKFAEAEACGNDLTSPLAVPLGVPTESLSYTGSLSEGAQATVFRGHWLGRDVAIKKAIIREAVGIELDRRGHAPNRSVSPSLRLSVSPSLRLSISHEGSALARLPGRPRSLPERGRDGVFTNPARPHAPPHSRSRSLTRPLSLARSPAFHVCAPQCRRPPRCAHAASQLSLDHGGLRHQRWPSHLPRAVAGTISDSQIAPLSYRPFLGETAVLALTTTIAPSSSSFPATSPKSIRSC